MCVLKHSVTQCNTKLILWTHTVDCYATYFLHPAPPQLWDGPAHVRTPVGTSVSFQYQVSGSPEPTVSWEHEDATISSDHVAIQTSGGVTSLTITNVTREDEGVYMCCALNSLGSATMETYLTVLGVHQTYWLFAFSFSLQSYQLYSINQKCPSHKLSHHTLSHVSSHFLSPSIPSISHPPIFPIPPHPPSIFSLHHTNPPSSLTPSQTHQVLRVT